MALVAAARRLGGRIGPIRAVTKNVSRDAARDVAVAVLGGRREGGDRLGALLGLDVTSGPHGPETLVVHAASDRDADGEAADALDRHRGQGGRVLILLPGGPATRRELERRYRRGRAFEEGDFARVDSLGATDAILDAIVLALGDDRVPAGRSNPNLRPSVARALIERASKKAGAIGAWGFLASAQLPVLIALQVRLVTELAALHDRPVGRDRALEIGGVIAAGYGWRGAARWAIRAGIPVPRLVMRGAVAYAATRGVGEAALRWFADGGGAPDRPLESLQRALRTIPRRHRA